MSVVQALEFPVSYNDDYLILLVRDPGCIYAYWELTEKRRKEVKNFPGFDLRDPDFILRVYDVTGVNSLKDAHGYFDLKVHPMADNYFIKGLQSRRSYCVELGVRSQEKFFSVLCSNMVQTPADNFADGSGIAFKDMLFSLSEKKDLKVGTYSTHGIYGNTFKD